MLTGFHDCYTRVRLEGDFMYKGRFRVEVVCPSPPPPTFHQQFWKHFTGKSSKKRLLLDRNLFPASSPFNNCGFGHSLLRPWCTYLRWRCKPRKVWACSTVNHLLGGRHLGFHTSWRGPEESHSWLYGHQARPHASVDNWRTAGEPRMLHNEGAWILILQLQRQHQRFTV